MEVEEEEEEKVEKKERLEEEVYNKRINIYYIIC
jgi:hypothetical protein